MSTRYVLTIFLTIALAPLVAWAKPWKGAELITAETFKYGAFEARVRAPRGSGQVVAFFLWKNDSELPGTEWQEQDFEIFGKNGFYQTQAMTPGQDGKRRTEHVVHHRLVTPAWEQYYTYRMEWTPEYIAYYVDDHLVRKETNPDEYAKLLDPKRAEPAQLRITLWAGNSDWSGEFDETQVPSAAFIEYISVAAHTPGVGDNGSDFSLKWRDDFEFLNRDRWWFANWTFSAAVNDYVEKNATTRDGKLVLALTSADEQGSFPAFAPQDNALADPYPDSTGAPQPPARAPAVIPGLIEAEDFFRYYDSTLANPTSASPCNRGYTVEMQEVGDDGCMVTDTFGGEWLEYDIAVPQTGNYLVTLRLAAYTTGASVRLSADEITVADEVELERTGVEDLREVKVPMRLAAGVRNLRLTFRTDAITFDSLTIDKLDSDGPTAPSDQPPQNDAIPVIPALLQAEDFTAAFDLTSNSTGDKICPGRDGVDLQQTGDTVGNCNVGFVDPGEWLEYQVFAETAGVYPISLRLSAPRRGELVDISINGSWQASVDVEVTGDWQTYISNTALATLQEGVNTLRVNFITGTQNFNYLTIGELHSSPDPTPQPNPQTCTGSIYEAESVYQSTGGSSGVGWNLWANGYIAFTHNFTAGSASIAVTAKGQSAASVAPNMNIVVGDTELGRWAVATSSYQDFAFQENFSEGMAEIRVAFDNDYYRNGEDRNLIVDKVVITQCP